MRESTRREIDAQANLLAAVLDTVVEILLEDSVLAEAQRSKILRGLHEINSSNFELWEPVRQPLRLEPQNAERLAETLARFGPPFNAIIELCGSDAELGARERARLFTFFGQILSNLSDWVIAPLFAAYPELRKKYMPNFPDPRGG